MLEAPAATHAATFCMADFILSASGPDATDPNVAAAALVALPKPLRAVLTSSAKCASPPLHDRFELPTEATCWQSSLLVGEIPREGVEAESQAWESFLGVSITCALGFNVKLGHMIKAHARSVLVLQLALHFPTAESLRALDLSEDALLAEVVRVCSGRCRSKVLAMDQIADAFDTTSAHQGARTRRLADIPLLKPAD